MRRAVAALLIALASLVGLLVNPAQAAGGYVVNNTGSSIWVTTVNGTLRVPPGSTSALVTRDANGIYVEQGTCLTIGIWKVRGPQTFIVKDNEVARVNGYSRC